MQLADYLARNNLSDAAFGDLIAVSRQAVHRYKTFDRFPERDVLARIREATNGEVTPDDFLPAPSLSPEPAEPESVRT